MIGTGHTFVHQSRNGDAARLWALTAAILAMCLLALVGTDGQARLRYDRHALLAGEWWRLLSAHFVHLGPRHLLFNLGGTLLLGLLFGRAYSLVRWLLIVLVSAAAVDAGLWFLRPGVVWYVGASGVLHGVWAAGAFAQLRRRHWSTAVPLVVLLAKLVFEQWRGVSVVMDDLPVILDAHWFGALGGSALALPLALRRKWL